MRAQLLRRVSGSWPCLVLAGVLVVGEAIPGIASGQNEPYSPPGRNEITPPFPLAANGQGKADEKTAEEIDKILPADVLKVSQEHWQRLRDLQRQHRDTLEQLQKAIASGQQNANVAERTVLLSQAAHVELDLCDSFAERQAAGRTFIRNLDHLKQSIEQKPGHSQADLLTIKSAWLSFEVEVERDRFDDRSPEQVQALLAQTQAALQTWRVVHAMFVNGFRRGEVDKNAYVGYLMCSRFAELLLALGKQDAAVEQLKQAYDCAELRTRATQAAYEAGTVTLDLPLEAQADRTKVWIELAKRDRKAAAEFVLGYRRRATMNQNHATGPVQDEPAPVPIPAP